MRVALFYLRRTWIKTSIIEEQVQLIFSKNITYEKIKKKIGGGMPQKMNNAPLLMRYLNILFLSTIQMNKSKIKIVITED